MNQTLNPQVSDAIAEVSKRLSDANREFLMPAIYQSAAQILMLGLQNAVAQQQRSYILRNAITAAAATAILQGKPAEADALLERLAGGRPTVPRADADTRPEAMTPASGSRQGLAESSVGLGDEIKIFLDALRTIADELNRSQKQTSAQ